MLVDSEWELIEQQWIDPEAEFRKKPRRNLKLVRKIYDEKERNEHEKNDIISADGRI